jgi:hypothetical protein
MVEFSDAAITCLAVFGPKWNTLDSANFTASIGRNLKLSNMAKGWILPLVGNGGHLYIFSLAKDLLNLV